ncbi:MAG: valine--tRNA ligase [Sulfurovum sp.]|nr:valine--tRNA ligase [Sulfurovum sp.]MCB4746179.1 valine--tRNA ligase [Sulfurovum sp.]MCB4750438.1 valine--tRNA ligase [Sulfurovum sp.]MCB4753869.1 valine--tRNA ligase [Sulfurovum sp.]MCB4758503.1 valine--tRNA ligase [Sulfurovum sp.]
MSETKKNVYNPKEIEENYYKLWEERGYFEVEGNKKIQQADKTFCIMMPPPNVTGHLHIGHGLTFTLQDIIIRYKRMDGYRTLWQPGTDHAGIATQNVVEKQLLAEGTTKEEIGREKFLERAWQQKDNSGSAITKQLRKLGVSPTWSRERFTMDEGLANAVKKAFKQMYDNGYIVRGNYMINWCTHDGALSDIEVEYEDHAGKLYHIRYPLSDGSGIVVVATTRPETYFGDTAVMVHPDDVRHKHLIGKTVTLPLIGRKVKIIADKHVDMEFGTGFVKVTPAHDPNDYEVGKRHHLEFITIFDENGILNEYCGNFSGMERLEAREKIVQKLEAEGFIQKIEDHQHQVGHCYRCKNIVEPYISKQWFVKKTFAKASIEKVNANKATFFPSHWINSYNAWMNDLRDWCISRQLWWGHQIPVMYCNDCGAEFAFDNKRPTVCKKCESNNIHQDEDVLDTWFSSGLWPFSTLGWGNGNTLKDKKWFGDDLNTFYPNQLLITGFDILFFWVARMLMMGENITGELPFKDIYLHALVKDEKGEKMSKSKGNVIDPLVMIEKYSADALRFTLAILAVQGRDIKLSEEKLEQSRNFTNKLFNAANYLQLNHSIFADLRQEEIQTPLGHYMLSRFNLAVKETRNYIDQYRFNDAATTLYRFLWGEFCDWGIELSKASKKSVAELGSIFKESLKLLHPFMPFITENLYQRLSGKVLEDNTSIMIMTYPKVWKVNEEITEQFNLAIEAIVSVRRCKTLIEKGNQRIEKATIKFNKPADTALLKPFIEKLTKVDKIEFANKKLDNCVTDVSNSLESMISTDDIDMSAIVNKLTKQKEKLEKELTKLNGMLCNKKFVANAPKQVIAQNRQQLEEIQAKLEKVETELKGFKV